MKTITIAVLMAGLAAAQYVPPSGGGGGAPSGAAGGGLTGTYPNPDLANPSTSTLGGVKSKASVSHQFLNAISTAGAPGSAQPACADLSDAGTGCSATLATVATSGSATDLGAGTLPAARLPNPSSSTLGGVQSKASVSHNFLNAISTSGVPGAAQPACGDLSDAGTGCTGSGNGSTESHTASASAALNFTTCISSTYNQYQIVFEDVLPATNSVGLIMQVSTDGGSSYDTGNNYTTEAWIFNTSATAVVGATSTSGFNVGGSNPGSISNTSNYGVRGSIILSNPNSAASYKSLTGTVGSFDSAWFTAVIGGIWKNNAAMNAFRIQFTSGNIASGTVRCYGLAK